MLILEFAIDRDEKKDKQAHSMSDGEKGGSYCACALTSMVNWWEEDCFACDNKKINCHYILLEHPVSFLRCCASLLLEAQWQKRSFSCIRQIHDLEIVVMHVHTIVILKIDTHYTCMTIHPSMKIASSLFIDRWIIRYLRNYNHRG